MSQSLLYEMSRKESQEFVGVLESPLRHVHWGALGVFLELIEPLDFLVDFVPGLLQRAGT